MSLIAERSGKSMGEITFKAWLTLHPEIPQLVEEVIAAGGPDKHRMKRAGKPRNRGRYGYTKPVGSTKKGAK